MHSLASTEVSTVVRRWETYRERGFDGFTFTELAEGGQVEASDQETHYPVLYIYPRTQSPGF